MELQVCGEAQGRKREQCHRYSTQNDINIGNIEEWGGRIWEDQGSMWQSCRYVRIQQCRMQLHSFIIYFSIVIYSKEDRCESSKCQWRITWLDIS